MEDINISVYQGAFIKFVNIPTADFLQPEQELS